MIAKYKRVLVKLSGEALQDKTNSAILDADKLNEVAKTIKSIVDLGVEVCIVVGAGNAGRPVARLLNYAGHTVKITDPKNIEDFHMDVQKTLRLMESEGVELDLGVFEPNLDGIDTVYLSPTVPENAPAYKIVKEANLNVFTNDDFGRLDESLPGMGSRI